jgi:cystathionine beta-lyase
MHPNYSQKQIDAFCDALRLFKLGYSWGGPMSLVVPYQLQHSRKRSTQHLRGSRVVRFCIGLEAVADLQADVAQALAVLGAP